MRLFMLLSLVMGIAVWLGGCASGERTAEREIEAAAARYLGSADRYTSDVTGLTATQARQVRLTGYGVRPAPNITLNSLVLTFADVEYRRSPFQITRVGAATFAVEVSDAAVAQYVAAQAPSPTSLSIRAPQVHFLQDQVRVAGVAVFQGQEVPVTTTGTLQGQGTRLLYLPQTITVEDTARGQLLRAAISLLQLPLLDLSRLTFEPQIQTIMLRPGVLTLTGTANANRLLEPAP